MRKKTHPGARPDVGTDLEDGEVHHEVDSGDELIEAASEEDEAAEDVEDVGHTTAPDKLQT